MRTALLLVFAAACLSLASCAGPAADAGWVVEKMEIPLYHATMIEPEAGFSYHVEYCGAKLTRGSQSITVVYRPMDFSERDPGFAAGDKVTVEGLDAAEDFGATDGVDYWIHDIKVFNPQRMRGF